MPPISNELAQALEPLNAQIKAAEKLLAGLPGVESQSFLFDTEGDEPDRFFHHIEFDKTGGAKTGLSVFVTDEYGNEESREWLESTKIDRRIEIVSTALPKFLDQCYQHAASLPKKATEAAKLLEDKLAEIENKIAIDDL